MAADGSTPWAELQALAAAVQQDRGGSGPRGPPETSARYIELARTRSYRAAPTDASSVYDYIASMGGKLVPHGSQGPPIYSSGNALDSGSFFDHLTGNEDCLRAWQRKDGQDVYADEVCLAGLCHSLYGTQGFQAFQFPIERRHEIKQMIGERGELLVYYTCAMERKTWRAFVLQNEGIQRCVCVCARACVVLRPLPLGMLYSNDWSSWSRGETPVGSFSGRRNNEGVWPHSGPAALSGDENWTLSAQEFSDMCALHLSHVVRDRLNALPPRPLLRQHACYSCSLSLSLCTYGSALTLQACGWTGHS